MINFEKNLLNLTDFLLRSLGGLMAVLLFLLIAVLFAAGLSEILVKKEKLCVNGSVYYKENDEYWLKTSKECVPSIPVSKV